MVQAAWQPLIGGESEWQEPQETILVTSSGRLLHGSVGRELHALEWMTHQHGMTQHGDQQRQPGTLVAWSEGGRVVAVGVGSRVTFWDFASQRSCWEADVSHLVSCSPAFRTVRKHSDGSQTLPQSVSIRTSPFWSASWPEIADACLLL